MIERVLFDPTLQRRPPLSPVSLLQPQLALWAACWELDSHVAPGTGSSHQKVERDVIRLVRAIWNIFQKAVRTCGGICTVLLQRSSRRQCNIAMLRKFPEQ